MYLTDFNNFCAGIDSDLKAADSLLPWSTTNRFDQSNFQETTVATMLMLSRFFIQGSNPEVHPRVETLQTCLNHFDKVTKSSLTTAREILELDESTIPSKDQMNDVLEIVSGELLGELDNECGSDIKEETMEKMLRFNCLKDHLLLSSILQRVRQHTEKCSSSIPPLDSLNALKICDALKAGSWTENWSSDDNVGAASNRFAEKVKKDQKLSSTYGKRLLLSHAEPDFYIRMTLLSSIPMGIWTQAKRSARTILKKKEKNVTNQTSSAPPELELILDGTSPCTLKSLNERRQFFRGLLRTKIQELAEELHVIGEVQGHDGDNFVFDTISSHLRYPARSQIRSRLTMRQFVDEADKNYKAGMGKLVERYEERYKDVMNFTIEDTDQDHTLAQKILDILKTSYKETKAFWANQTLMGPWELNPPVILTKTGAAKLRKLCRDTEFEGKKDWESFKEVIDRHRRLRSDKEEEEEEAHVTNTTDVRITGRPSTLVTANVPRFGFFADDEAEEDDTSSDEVEGDVRTRLSGFHSKWDIHFGGPFEEN